MSKHTWMKNTALVAAGAIGASALTGIAVANTTTADQPNPPASAPMGGPMHGGPGGPGGPGRHGGELGMPLHGTAVVDKNGTFVNTAFANGDVTAVSATSITIKSSDGVETTFVINDKTVVDRNFQKAAATDVVVGDKARAMGTVDGGTITAVHVGAMDPAKADQLEKRMKKMHKKFEQQRKQQAKKANAA